MRKVPHFLHSAPKRGQGQEPLRIFGFTTIELAVSLGIFLMVSTVVTLAVARSLGVGSTAKLTRTSEAAASDMLNVLSTYDYDDLVAGTFTVPSPCAGTATGIDGRSCVEVSGTEMQVRYYYQFLDPVSGKGTCPDTVANPLATGSASGQELADSEGRVGLCAIANTIAGEIPDYAIMVQRSVNAPSSGYEAGKATIRVFVSGDENIDNYPSSLVLVSDANPTMLIAGPVAVADGQAAFTVDPLSQCTPLSPCAVAVAPTVSPVTVQNTGLFGPAARPGAGILAREGVPVDVTVEVAHKAILDVNLEAAGSAPSQVDTVCLNGWFSNQSNMIRECNDEAANRVRFDNLVVSQSGVDINYPIAPGAEFTASVDSPNFNCPPGGRAPESNGTWVDSATCTSWVWGNAPDATFLTEPVGLLDPVPSTTLVWPAGTPAAGLTDGASPWTQARIQPGCAADASCSPVLDPPEDYACPGEACLSLGGN